MSKWSLESKCKKRRLQKAKKKRILQRNEELCTSADLSVVSEDRQACSENLENSTFSIACGEDFVAVEMRLENCLKDNDEEYPYEYLIKCRERLHVRVEHYRSEVQTLKDKITEQALQHRKQLEQVRDFYRNITY